jgi:hypothetical protein
LVIHLQIFRANLLYIKVPNGYGTTGIKLSMAKPHAKGLTRDIKQDDLTDGLETLDPTPLMTQHPGLSDRS